MTTPLVERAEDTVPAEPEEATREPREPRFFSRYAWQIPIAFACVILGIMGGVQFQAQSKRPPVQADNTRQLLELVRTLEAERNKLSVELTDTRNRMAKVEEAAGRRETLSTQMQEQVERSRIEAGLTGMRGPGITVQLSDSRRAPGPEEDPYFYIVHDVDIQALVNELWAAGAEAVSVNNQRVVTRTSIRCVGPTVLVNGVRMAAPYVVKAIGPSADLEMALRMPGGFLDSMAQLIKMGGEVKMNRSQELSVEPFDGSLIFRYGRPFEGSKDQAGPP
jgi:uncharacterized protein YlxW (UPF0749 family)